MPVILRLCVAIEKATPQPPPTSIFLNSAPPTQHAVAAAGSSPSPAATASGDAPSRINGEEQRAAAQSQSVAKDSKKSKSGSKKASFSPSPSHPGRHNGRHNLLHWLRRHYHKEKTTVSTEAAKRDNSAPQPEAAGAEAAQSSSQPQRGDLLATHLSGPSAVDHHVRHSLVSPRTAGVAEATTKTAALRGEGREGTGAAAIPAAEATPPPQRSLVWVSLQLTPATTVKAVLQQVHDMVKRRMGAGLCEDSDVSALSAPATPGGSFATAPQKRAQIRHRGGDGGSGGNTHGAVALPIVQVISPTSSSGPTTPDAVEWCLCLQDSDGIFHWVGSTRHYQKTAVLHAPFVTEACLQSHAKFEAARQQQQAEAASSEQQNSFATTCGPPGAQYASDADSLDATMNASDGSSLTSSGDGDDDDDDDGEGSGRRRHFLAPLHRHYHHHRPTHNKSWKADKKKGSKSDANAAAGDKGDSKNGEKAHKSHVVEKKLPGPSANSAKFAFLKGVVVSSAVLKLRNPSLTRHRRKPPLFIEVHVPRELRADPLDPSSTTTPEGREAAAVPSASAPAADPVSSAEVGNSLVAQRSPESFASKEEDVDVDVDEFPGAAVAVPAAPAAAAAAVPVVTAPSSSSSFSSSASTLPSHSPPRDGLKKKLHTTRRPSEAEATAAAVVRVADATHGGWMAWYGESKGSEGPLSLPVGLATHATALDGLSSLRPATLSTVEEGAWCRTADAAQVKDVDAKVLKELTAEEDAAQLGLASAQRGYAAALADYRAAVPPTPASIHQRPDTTTGSEADSVAADTELTALMRRKIELQASVEDGRQAERQCERLTTLVECLEKELREREERRALLLLPVCAA